MPRAAVRRTVKLFGQPLNRNRPVEEHHSRVRESDLLERLRLGDAEAFETIFRSHYAPLVSAAAALTRDGATAEEIVQEVMLELWRRKAELVIDSSLRAYLFRATRNRALNQLRHERVVQDRAMFAAGETSTPSSADATLTEHEIDAAVEHALTALPERCREVFELSRKHGLRYAEIADVLGISVKTVEAQMGKALRILRDKLSAWLPPANGM